MKNLTEKSPTLDVKLVRNVIVTRSLLVIGLKGIVRASIFNTIDRKGRFRLWIQSILSILKNGVKTWKGNDSIFIFHLWSRGYYHWLTEIAIKIVMFENLVRKKTIVLPVNPPVFMIEFFKITGITDYRVMARSAFFKKLWIISNPLPGYPNPEHILKLREFIFNRMPIKKFEYKKIYVSRRLSRARKIINEEEVVAVLKEKGFMYLELETMQWTDQVNAFRNCSELISIHGAGLTNVIFMPTGSSVIELFPKDSVVNPCYVKLCEAVEVKHDFLFSQREVSLSKPNFHKDNLFVNRDDLISILEGNNKEVLR